MQPAIEQHHIKALEFTHGSWVSSLALSADAKQLISGFENGTIITWRDTGADRWIKHSCFMTVDDQYLSLVYDAEAKPVRAIGSGLAWQFANVIDDHGKPVALDHWAGFSYQPMPRGRFSL